MDIRLYVICHFSLVAFNILSLVFNFCQFDYWVSGCAPPWVYPAWDSLCFLDLVDYFLSHIRKAFSYYLFKYFLRSFLSLFSLWNPIMQMLVPLMLSQRSLRLSSFLFILLSLLCSAPVISTILSSRSFTPASTSVILLLIPSSVLFKEKAMATHSSTLAWRIPGMAAEPGGLLSMGSHRVRHD